MEISRFLPFIGKGDKPAKAGLFFKINDKYPRLGITLSITIAAIGILFLLMFPYLLITTPFDLYATLTNIEELKDWIDAGIQLLIIVLAAGFSWAIISLKFSVPSGLDITEEKFPHLYKLIEELREEFGNPKIDRVILRDKYEISVIKSPRNKTPILTSTTLIIGLPVLLTMSPLYFRALLARRIGQLSTQHTPVSTRLYYLNDIWAQFKISCKRSKNIFAKILGYGFQLYCAVYEKITLPLIQHEELEADSYGMDIVPLDDMIECIVYDETVNQFLAKKYWPKIYHMAKRSKVPEFLPYAQMTKVVIAGITDDEISQAIQAALKVDIDHPAPEPSLRKRLNHIGQEKPLAPKRLSKTAAGYYLGNSQAKVIQLFDKRWLSKLKGKL